MIIATIQGKNKKEETITTLNGEFVYGDEEQRCIDKILANTKNIGNIGKQKFCSVNDNFIVFIDHPEKDDIGRIRTAMVFYNKDITKEEIYKTIEKMGLDIQNFDKLLQLRMFFASSMQHSKPRFQLSTLSDIIYYF